jgi:hypothetical protein
MTPAPFGSSHARHGRRSSGRALSGFAGLGVALVLGAAFTIGGLVYLSQFSDLQAGFLPYVIGSSLAVVAMIAIAGLAPRNE